MDCAPSPAIQVSTQSATSPMPASGKRTLILIPSSFQQKYLSRNLTGLSPTSKTFILLIRDIGGAEAGGDVWRRKGVKEQGVKGRNSVEDGEEGGAELWL